MIANETSVYYAGASSQSKQKFKGVNRERKSLKLSNLRPGIQTILPLFSLDELLLSVRNSDHILGGHTEFS